MDFRRVRNGSPGPGFYFFKGEILELIKGKEIWKSKVDRRRTPLINADLKISASYPACVDQGNPGVLLLPERSRMI